MLYRNELYGYERDIYCGAPERSLKAKVVELTTNAGLQIRA